MDADGLTLDRDAGAPQSHLAAPSGGARTATLPAVRRARAARSRTSATGAPSLRS